MFLTFCIPLGQSDIINSSSTSITLDVIRVSADPAEFAQISVENGNLFSGCAKHGSKFMEPFFSYVHLISNYRAITATFRLV